MTAERERFLNAAVAIGRRLCRDAVWHEGRCNWLGWAMEPHGGQWVSAYRAMGAPVYDGAAGIGLFLSRLVPLTGDPIIATTAEVREFANCVNGCGHVIRGKSRSRILQKYLAGQLNKSPGARHISRGARSIAVVDHHVGVSTAALCADEIMHFHIKDRIVWLNQS